jgi:hypothetical protein
MKRRARDVRLDRWGRAALFIILLLTVQVLGFSQVQPGGEVGIGVGRVMKSDSFDLGPFNIGFVSFRGPMKRVQFAGSLYFTIPPAPGFLASGNVVVNLAKSGFVDPYLIGGLGAVIPYFLLLPNAGGGLKFAISDRLALILEYRYWLGFMEEFPGAGTFGVQLSFRL